MHSVRPEDGATDPKEQLWHDDNDTCPVWLLYDPGGQLTKDDAFGQYPPFGHTMHSVRPEDGATNPKEQFWHDDNDTCPVWLLYDPGGHGVTAPAVPVQ